MKVFDEKKAVRLVDIALEKGVTLFDTGPNYSGANAEKRLGRALKGKSDSVLVATKVGSKLVNGRHVKDYSPGGIEESVRSSLKNLQLDYLPLLQFHGFPKPADEAIEKILELKDSGVVRHIGVSSDGRGARRAVETGVFDCLMIEYNILNRTTPSKTIDSAADRGMGVIVKSPLAQTLYSNEIFRIGKPSDLWYMARALKNHREKFARGRKFRFVNDVPGMAGSDVALSYVLNNSHVSSAVIGTVNPVHLRNNIESAQKTLPAELISRIESV